MGGDGRRLRWVAERWPAVLVVPAFSYTGHAWWTVAALSIVAVLLTELIFTFAKIMWLERE